MSYRRRCLLLRIDLGKSKRCREGIEISNANEATVLGSIEKMEKINFEFKINMNDGIEELISKKRNSELFIS